MIVDFAELWREQSRRRIDPDTPERWNSYITESPHRFGPSSYSEDFLALAQLLPNESVFDMGCGAGTLAIPCAADGHSVTAADFAEAMLEQLTANVQELDKTLPGTIRTVHLSWEDDWSEHGILPRSHDVAFASRSIITQDLEDSVLKLSAVARRKVCVTVSTGDSPRVFHRLLRDIGLHVTGHPDAAFVFAVATQLGFQPDVSYIRSVRRDYFSSKEEAFEKYRGMIAFSDEQPEGAKLAATLNRLNAWLDAHLVPASSKPVTDPAEELRELSHFTNPDSLCTDSKMTARNDSLTTDIDRIVPWAFIQWNVQE